MLPGFLVYKQTASLKRLTRDAADADLEGYSLVCPSVKVNIQPAGLEYQAMFGDGQMGRIFKGFTTFSGCQIGMELVTSGTVTVSGMRYGIIGMEPWNGPMGHHTELLLRLNVN